MAGFRSNQTHGTDAACIGEVRASYIELNPRAKGDLTCSEIYVGVYITSSLYKCRKPGKCSIVESKSRPC